MRKIVKPPPELADLVPAFMASRLRDAQTILDKVRQGDIDAVRSLGHQMSGLGGSYGFEHVSDLGRQIEQAARRKDAPTVERLATELRQYLSEVEVVYPQENDGA